MIKIGKTLFSFLFLLFFFTPFVFAHGEELNHLEEVKSVSLESFLTTTSFWVIGVASAIAFSFVLLAIFLKPATEKVKKLLFLGIVIPIILATFYLVSATIYLNLVSQSRGPVHHHADFEIWICGKKIDLINPEGLSNRVGTSTFHEHNDGRIHVEGVVVDKSDVSLDNFFRFIGGDLQKDSITIPTTEGVIHQVDGDLCDDSPGILQVFVYQIKDRLILQKKLDDPSTYAISPFQNVPPGDCIIFEFTTPKEKTDKLCSFYKLAMEKGEIHGP